VKILARARRPHGPTALLRRGSRPRKGRSGGSSHPRVAVVGCRAGQAPRLCSPCGSWCHGNTRTAPSAQSSSGWSPTHGESAGIRPSDVSRTTSRGHRAAKGERTSWGAATSSLCVYRGSGCVGPRVASVGPRGTHSGCDEIGPGGNLVGRPPPIARFSI